MEWKLERRDETIYIDGIAIVSAGGWEDADSLVSRVNSWLASYEKDITKLQTELTALRQELAGAHKERDEAKEEINKVEEIGDDIARLYNLVEPSELNINRRLNIKAILARIEANLTAANNRVSELQAENVRLQQALEDSENYGDHLVSLIQGIVDTESKASDEEIYVMAMKMAIVPLRQETLIWQAQDDEDSKVMGIALTPPEPEARYVVVETDTYGFGQLRFTVQDTNTGLLWKLGGWAALFKDASYVTKGDALIRAKKFEAQARADELNASDS